MPRELLRIKRSFHCEDLPSIVDLRLHASSGDGARRREGTEGARSWSMSVPNSPCKRIKRQRAISDLSIDFFEEIPTTTSPETMMMTPSPSSHPHPSVVDIDDGCLTPKASGSSSSSSSSSVRSITPASSHVTVVAPSSSSRHLLDAVLTPSPRSFDFTLTPRRSNDLTPEEGDVGVPLLPATAALERFMLLSRRDWGHPPPLLTSSGEIDDYSPSFEVEDDEDGVPAMVSSSAASDVRLDSARRVEDFPWGCVWWDEGGGGGGGRRTQEERKRRSSFSAASPVISPPGRSVESYSYPQPVSFTDAVPPPVVAGVARRPVSFLPPRRQTTTATDDEVRRLAEALSRL